MNYFLNFESLYGFIERIKVKCKRIDFCLERIIALNREKKKFRININLIFAIVLLVIIGICIWRLIEWNRRSVEVDTDVAYEDFATECLDYYSYPESPKERPEGWKEHILVVGNLMVDNRGEKLSILNIMKAKLDAEITAVVARNTKVACYNEIDETTNATDAFSLYYTIRSLCTKDFSMQKNFAASNGNSASAFGTVEEQNYYIDTISAVNMEDIDTLIIMYSLQDYYAQVTPVYEGAIETRITSYYGALCSSINMLQEYYPHINIILCSPAPEYFVRDGEIETCFLADYGNGNASSYINLMGLISMNKFISYIDNYYYGITEDNIEQFVLGFDLNEAGINLIGNHIVNFLKNR